MADIKYDDNWPFFEKVLGYLRYITIRKYIADEGKPICVDIGCGFNGRFLFGISKKIKKGYGFDIRANPVSRGNIRIVNNSAWEGYIPLKDESVDRSFLLAVIEHLDGKSVVIPESIRILKRGGKIIITTPTPESKPLLEFLSFRLGLISRESILEHKHYYNEVELKQMLEEFGCKCEKYKKFQLGMNQMLVGRKG